MARRLVKTASEFNVGTSSIVEFLQKKGFTIENKPTANISDEMFEELKKEFGASQAIKEKAEALVIGKMCIRDRQTVWNSGVCDLIPDCVLRNGFSGDSDFTG